MLQKIRKMMKNDKGFTLIELMVVVVILGILAAIAIPRFTNNTEQATKARIDADIKILQNAVDMYYFEEEAYPLGAENEANWQLLVDNNYLQDVPTHPRNGGKYLIDQTNGRVTANPAD